MADRSTQEPKTFYFPDFGKIRAADFTFKLDNVMEDVQERKSKRKASTEEGPSDKKLRGDTESQTSSPVMTVDEGAGVRGNKRRADETDEEHPNKKLRTSTVTSITEPSSGVSKRFRVRRQRRRAYSHTDRSSKMSSGLSLKICTSCSSSSSEKEEGYDLSFAVKTNRAEFEGSYYELSKLGSGGFGSVYEGYRRNDMTPVAIKHIPKELVDYTEVVQDGKEFKVIDEVALMVKAAGGAESAGTSAAISLLDCFDLEEELILVMERPTPSMDLYRYRRAKGGYLQEDEAKIILKQMVDAALDMHQHGVFHRDIKLLNVLVETGSAVPRVRVIDFGCGCLVTSGHYYCYSGTFTKAPPEWFLDRQYQAEPTTVWQLGALLYDLLDHQETFETSVYLRHGVEICPNLTTDCKDFLRKCLIEDPDWRATLLQLKYHPWLR
ncbi:serine/threonine-protein kinase pim-2-like [Plectropomus leopardus]|uniref:serine/threonine-protein kinase pim-2-like n=1 Tax=Plectropomus leopardus TaxID=160734 RepID=UPI001C4B0379|nr:serine/threonine-protein kinase pim-2-like [Plectropomus leopardus]